MMSARANPSLEEIIHRPIEIPQNPFVERFKSFGTDEAVALLISLAGTAFVKNELQNDSLIQEQTKRIYEAIAGPVAEKISFPITHAVKAAIHYGRAPEDNRKPFVYYQRKEWREGVKNLKLNLLVQDPLYVGLMYQLMNIFPNVSPIILAAPSFIVSVAAASAIHVGTIELLYANLKRKLKKAGFTKESYYESRFYIDMQKHPEHRAVLEQIAKHFQLDNRGSEHFYDEYFATHLPIYNARVPQLRLREKKNGSSDNKMVQIAYSRKVELEEEEEKQKYHYFPQKKDNFSFRLLQREMPHQVREISSKRIRKLVQKAVEGDECWNLEYHRRYACNEQLLCTVDDVLKGYARPFFVLELKAHDPKVIEHSIHFVRDNFDLVETNQGKLELTGKSVDDYCR